MNTKSKKYKQLYNLLQKQILVLDGGMGTYIYFKLINKLFNKELNSYESKNISNFNSDLLVFSNPEIIKNIHEEYLAAGADIIETCTFNSYSSHFFDNKIMSIYDINKQAALIAKEIANKYTAVNYLKPRFVAAAIGPTNKCCSNKVNIINDKLSYIDYNALVSIYYEQIQGLYDGGTDLLIIETVYDINNCKAAIEAITKFNKSIAEEEQLPVIISLAVNQKNGKIFSGESIETVWLSINNCPNLLSFGINCGNSIYYPKELIMEISTISKVYTCFYPSAGLPDNNGIYAENIKEFVPQIKTFLDCGLLNIIGGCCGTTPKYISELVKISDNSKIRMV